MKTYVTGFIGLVIGAIIGLYVLGRVAGAHWRLEF